MKDRIQTIHILLLLLITMPAMWRVWFIVWWRQAWGILASILLYLSVKVVVDTVADTFKEIGRGIPE